MGFLSDEELEARPPPNTCSVPIPRMRVQRRVHARPQTEKQREFEAASGNTAPSSPGSTA